MGDGRWGKGWGGFWFLVFGFWFLVLSWKTYAERFLVIPAYGRHLF
jgi:hypothetical protein